MGVLDLLFLFFLLSSFFCFSQSNLWVSCFSLPVSRFLFLLVSRTVSRRFPASRKFGISGQICGCPFSRPVSRIGMTSLASNEQCQAKRKSKKAKRTPISLREAKKEAKKDTHKSQKKEGGTKGKKQGKKGKKRKKRTPINISADKNGCP